MCLNPNESSFNLAVEVVDGRLVREGTRHIHFCRCCEHAIPAQDLLKRLAVLVDGEAVCRHCRAPRTAIRHARLFTRSLPSFRRRYWSSVACGG